MAYQFSFFALGTQWWIEVFDEIGTEAGAAVEDSCARLVTTFENNYSRFKPDSLVSALNRERRLEAPSEECRALLGYGKQLYLRTNTHFNFLTGHIQEARGYDPAYSFTPHEAPDPAGNPVTDLIITPEAITLTRGNVDLGGYGKGYLIDEVATLLQREHNLHYFLINGGGDMLVTSQFGEPIEILLEHPTEPDTYLQKTTLLNQGFAASSPFKRIWHTETGTYSHIMRDESIPQIASFVKAPTARDADAFATTSLLIDDTELADLATCERIGVARFTPTTNQFQTYNWE